VVQKEAFAYLAGGLIMNKRRCFFTGAVISVKLTITLLCILSILACHTGASPTKGGPTGQEIKPKENPYTKAEITTRIIPSANNTFGYDILLYGKPLVHQPNIPGIPGNEGFATQERAQTVAEFVVKKIRNNEMPPTVTIEDLNTMGVLK
jgi:hypothetical protein